MKQVPEILDKMADAVLAYRPAPKSKAAKRRRAHWSRYLAPKKATKKAKN